ncbi:MAG TPA: hypothetical protein VIY86_01030, partial [Pirellulaceae bacterium]
EAEDGIRTAPLVLGRMASWWPTAEQPPPDPQVVAVTEIPAREREKKSNREETDAGNILGPRAYWEQLGVFDDEWQRFQGSDRNSSDYQRMLMRLLTRLDRIPLGRIQSWRRELSGWPEWVSSPEAPGSFVRLSGVLEKCDTEVLSQELADRFGFRTWYRCHVKCDDIPQPVQVITRNIPLAWKKLAESELRGERVEASAVLVAPEMPRSEAQEEVPAARGPNRAALFLTRGLSWFPTKTRSSPRVSNDQVVLARIGFDIATLDGIRDPTRMAAEDTAAFYELLRVMSDANASTIRAASSPATPIQLLRSPEEYRGSLCTFRGLARRAIRVRVDSPDTIARFGIRDYVEAVVFVELDTPIRVRDEGGEDREFSRYPLVFCCRTWPTAWPLGETIRVPVRIQGAFLKNWAYPVAPLDDSSQPASHDAFQVSPMLVGLEPHADRMAAPPNSNGTIWLTFIMLGLLAAMVGLLWHYARVNQRAERASQTPAPTDWSHLADSPEVTPPDPDKVR